MESGNQRKDSLGGFYVTDWIAYRSDCHRRFDVARKRENPDGADDKNDHQRDRDHRRVFVSPAGVRALGSFEQRSSSPGPVRVLGIDLSQNATGLAMIEPAGDSVTLLLDALQNRKIESSFTFDKQFYYHGALIIPRSTNVLTRWDQILLPVLDWAQHAQHVMIEGYAFSNQHAYVRTLAELGGIVRYHLRKLGHVPIEISPSSLKKFLVDNGRAKKPEILEAVRKTVPSIYDHNMADAFGLAQIGCAIYQTGLDLPRHQAETIYRITHPEEKPTKRNRVVSIERRNAKSKTLFAG